MTKQETFNKVVTAIIAQGRPSISGGTWSGGTCAYRGAGGAKCAAGILIPDDKYEVVFEGLRVVKRPTGTNQETAERLRDLIASEGHDIGLVHDLQNAHDSSVDRANFVEAFKRKARFVAGEHELDPSACGPAEVLP